jgi:hypothetical protein
MFRIQRRPDRHIGCIAVPRNAQQIAPVITEGVWRESPFVLKVGQETVNPLLCAFLHVYGLFLCVFFATRFIDTPVR